MTVKAEIGTEDATDVIVLDVLYNVYNTKRLQLVNVLFEKGNRNRYITIALCWKVTERLAIWKRWVTVVQLKCPTRWVAMAAVYRY